MIYGHDTGAPCKQNWPWFWLLSPDCLISAEKEVKVGESDMWGGRGAGQGKGRGCGIAVSFQFKLG